jgi:AAA family ATP:ADP antiporter
MEAVSVASRQVPLARGGLIGASARLQARSKAGAAASLPIHARKAGPARVAAEAPRLLQMLQTNSSSLQAFATPSEPARRFNKSKRFAAPRASAAVASGGAESEGQSEVLAVPFTAAAPAAPVKKFLGTEIPTLKKIVPLGLMFFCILFNYTILRDTKDVLVVTAPGSGAEIIPFLKTWVNLPAAIGFAVLYSDLSNKLSKEMLFYACILPFIAFFGSFAFVLYPLRDFLHPTAFVDSVLRNVGPIWAPRLAAPLSILRNWTFCVFYVAAELWGSVVVSVLFWGFANQVSVVSLLTTI